MKYINTPTKANVSGYRLERGSERPGVSESGHETKISCNAVSIQGSSLGRELHREPTDGLVSSKAEIGVDFKSGTSKESEKERNEKCRE